MAGISKIRKKYKIKPKTIHKKVFNKIIENNGNVSKSMRDVGYSPKTAKNPRNLIESKGFQMLCEERGLTDIFLVDALVEDIKIKKQNRKAELELGFKIKGRLKDTQEIDLTIKEYNWGDYEGDKNNI